MSKAKASAVSVTIPNSVELVSKDLEATTAFVLKSFGWNGAYLPEWKMSFVNWGVQMTGMFRTEMPSIDKGRAQRAILYFNVPDIDKEFKRLIKLGATSLKEPSPIPGVGQWGYILTPGNVIIGIWADEKGYVPKHAEITKKPGEESTATFYEFINSEPEAVTAFFSKAFGWTFREYDFGAKYWYFSSPSFSAGLRAPKKGEKDHNFIPYINANDLVAKTAETVKGGAKKVGGLVEFEPYGSYQLINLPGNVPFGIWASSNDHKGTGEHHEETAKAPAKSKAAPKTVAKKAVASKAKKATKRAAPKAAAAKRSREATAKESKRPTKRARRD